MKRSEINAIMEDAIAFFERHSFRLPPFAFWSPGDWERAGPEADEIRRCHLGWDLTDFGLSDYHNTGLLLFTVRNGDAADPANPKTYAEKAMVVEEVQVTPWHFHTSKIEDIIVRGGGDLVVHLSNTDAEGNLVDTPVTVATDGVARTVESGGTVTLTPGESVTLPQGLAHRFYGRSGAGVVLVGEVSSVNDDRADNTFIEPVGRFPEIEEDAAPLHLLCNEYPPPKTDGA